MDAIGKAALDLVRDVQSYRAALAQFDADAAVYRAALVDLVKEAQPWMYSTDAIWRSSLPRVS